MHRDVVTMIGRCADRWPRFERSRQVGVLAAVTQPFTTPVATSPMINELWHSTKSSVNYYRCIYKPMVTQTLVVSQITGWREGEQNVLSGGRTIYTEDTFVEGRSEELSKKYGLKSACITCGWIDATELLKHYLLSIVRYAVLWQQIPCFYFAFNAITEKMKFTMRVTQTFLGSLLSLCNSTKCRVIREA